MSKEPLTVCMAIHTFHLGGCELQLLSLCKALRALNVKLILIYSHIRTSKKNIQLEGVECYQIPKFFHLYRLVPLYLFFLFKLKVKKYPSLFHCHAISFFTEQIIWFAKWNQLPTLIKVTVDNDVTNLKRRIQQEKSLWKWIKTLYKKESLHVKKLNLENALFGSSRKDTYSKVTGFLSINPNIREELVSFPIDTDRIFSITNGVDVHRFRPIDEEEKTRLKGKLGLALNQKFILMVARFAPSKRYEDLIFAWSRIEKSYPEHLLLLIGEGSERNHCELLASTLHISSRLLFLGERAQIEKYLQVSSLFAFTSCLEGHSNAILEAMATALPIVATSISGIKEVLVSGKEGLLVNPGDIAPLAKAIAYMLDHPGEAERMGSAAREKAIKDYSFEQIAPRFVQLYEKIVRTQEPL